MFFRISQEKKAKFIKSRRFQSTCQGSQVQIFSSLLAPQTRTRTKLIRVKATPGVIQNPLNFPLARESPRPEMKKGPPFVPKSISSRIFHAFRGPPARSAQFCISITGGVLSSSFGRKFGCDLFSVYILVGVW